MRRTQNIIMLFLLQTLWLVGWAAPASGEDGRLSFSAGLMLSKAYDLMQDKAYAKAVEIISTFQAKAKKRPAPDGADHPEIYVALGNCHLMLKDFASAKTSYQKALASNSTHTGAWFNLAKTHYELKDFLQAANCFFQAYANEADPEKNPEHLYYSGVSYLEAGVPQRAVEIFKTLLKTYAAAAKPIWKEHLVQAYFALDQPREALPLIEALANTYTGEKQVQWQEILLYQYISLEMPAKAKELATVLARKNPTREKWWKALVHIHLNTGQEEAALAALTVYGYLTPLTLEEKRLLADLHLQLGIPVKSIPLYAEMIKEKPAADTVYHLAVAYQQTGASDAALDCINAHAPDTRDTDLLMLKGNLLYGMDRFKEAALVFQQAGKNAKEAIAGQAWLMAGYAAMQGKDPAAGRMAFNKAAKYKRHKKAAAKALAELEQMTAFNASQNNRVEVKRN